MIRRENGNHYICIVLHEVFFYIVKIAAVEGIKRFSGNPSFKFFYGMALVMEGRVQEGIRELDPLQTYSEVSCFEEHTTVNSLLTFNDYN